MPFLGCFGEGFESIRQFARINHPVAERRIIGVALVLSTEPAVVHHKEFTAESGDVVHHGEDLLLGDVEIDAFP